MLADAGAARRRRFGGFLGGEHHLDRGHAGHFADRGFDRGAHLFERVRMLGCGCEGEDDAAVGNIQSGDLVLGGPAAEFGDRREVRERGENRLDIGRAVGLGR